MGWMAGCLSYLLNGIILYDIISYVVISYLDLTATRAETELMTNNTSFNVDGGRRQVH